MVESVTTTPKSEEAPIELTLITFAELTTGASDEQTQIAAAAIANFVNKRKEGDKQMLPVSPADIAQKRIGIIALSPLETVKETIEPTKVDYFSSRLAGYVGAMEPIEHDPGNGTIRMTEVGSLKVDGSLRGHGVGTILLDKIVRAAQNEDLTPYAFCNPDSLPIAERIGGREINSPDEVPPEALALCQECPLYGQGSKKYGCCDTVMVWDKTQNADG